MIRLSLILALTACGSGLPSGDDTGEGSNTLEIQASLDVSNNFTNAADANDFATELSVEVSRLGAPVLDAVVTIETDDDVHELLPNLDEDGDYEVTTVGYARRYRLSVASGDDYVGDVRLEGPDIHTFATPLAGASVDGNLALTLEWDRGDAAEVAAVETREMDRIEIEDTGSFTLPVGSLKHDEDEVNDERIRLWRTNQLSLAGGAGNSTFAVSVRNEIEILVSP